MWWVSRNAATESSSHLYFRFRYYDLGNGCGRYLSIRCFVSHFLVYLVVLRDRCLLRYIYLSLLHIHNCPLLSYRDIICSYL